MCFIHRWQGRNKDVKWLGRFCWYIVTIEWDANELRGRHCFLLVIYSRSGLWWNSHWYFHRALVHRARWKYRCYEITPGADFGSGQFHGRLCCSLLSRSTSTSGHHPPGPSTLPSLDTAICLGVNPHKFWTARFSAVAPTLHFRLPPEWQQRVVSLFTVTLCIFILDWFFTLGNTKGIGTGHGNSI